MCYRSRRAPMRGDISPTSAGNLQGLLGHGSHQSGRIFVVGAAESHKTGFRGSAIRLATNNNVKS